MALSVSAIVVLSSRVLSSFLIGIKAVPTGYDGKLLLKIPSLAQRSETYCPIIEIPKGQRAYQCSKEQGIKKKEAGRKR